MIIRSLKETDIPEVTNIQKQAVLEGLASFALEPLNEKKCLKNLKACKVMDTPVSSQN